MGHFRSAIGRDLQACYNPHSLTNPILLSRPAGGYQTDRAYMDPYMDPYLDPLILNGEPTLTVWPGIRTDSLGSTAGTAGYLMPL